MPRKRSSSSKNGQLDFPQTARGIEKMPMSSFTEQAYLNYSMYVILDRALPALSDGLKPVQRRIVYAMSDLGLYASAKYKKSARTVGDVLGKFHPHGDSACYEAMVLMAQPFSYRYPLIDGQGNWGSQDDPKSFAAMRYTEARLTKYAQILLDELGQGTVEWKANFDSELEEPVTLPARLPNVLLNGTSGIAVGMSTDIPPHNIREVVSACIRLLEQPTSTLSSLCKHVKGPDFPTRAEIISTPEEIRQIYKSGNGSLRQRAVWSREKTGIVIHELPYQVSGGKIQEQIAAQMLAKKLPMVADLRDESDQDNPTRLVIEPRSNRVECDALMSHLFATTDLEKSYRVNLNAIGIDGRPRVYSLKSLLEEWIKFRLITVKRRLTYRLEKVQRRLHILAGLLIAYLNIDEVIRIIRNEDHPKQALMDAFDLTEIQTEAILEIRLRQLAKLEEIKIRGEADQLEQERKQLEKILRSKDKLKKLVRDELIIDAETFGDERRSPIRQREAARAMDHNELIPVEPVTIIMSAKGWIRAAKGHEIDAENLNFKVGDNFHSAVKGKTNELFITIDSNGRTYSLSPHNLPSARSFGEPLSSNLNPKPGTTFAGIMIGQQESEYLLSNDAGFGFVASLGDLHTRNKSGKAVLRNVADSIVFAPQRVFAYEDDWLAVITNVGRLLIIPVGEINRLSKGKGVKLINIPTARFKSGEEKVVDVVVLREGEKLKITCGQRYMKLKPVDFDTYVGSRAARGRFLPKGFRQVRRIEALEK